MIEQVDIVLAGVGGQGTLVAGKLLGYVAQSINLDVRVSEVHGMAQRGGSVVTYVRMAERVFSPVIEPGCARFILAFEELEALRWAHLLARDGVLLVNEHRIMPITVKIKRAEYPRDPIGSLREAAQDRAIIRQLPATRLARQAGHEKAVNMVMIGALSRFLDIPQSVYTQAIDCIFTEKFREMNQKAFQAGSDIMDT